MALLGCQHRTLVELSRGESLFPSLVRDNLVTVLGEIDEKEALIALSQPEHSKANFDTLVLERLRNRLPTAFSIERKAQVFTDTRHENDFSIIGSDFAISVEIEKGDRARLDLDIRKMEAFARQSPKLAFGVFVVPSNNRLDRSISGNSQESSFDYVCRTLRLSALTSARASLPNVTTQGRIENALDLLKRGLKPFIDHQMGKLHGKDWERSMQAQKPAVSGDVQWLLKVMLNNWNDFFAPVLTRTERTLAHEALDVRNRWAHQETFSPDDTYRALDTIERLLCAVNAAEHARELKQQREDLHSQLSRGQARGTLIDVLVIGYLSPKAQTKIPDELPRSKVRDVDLSVRKGSQQTALNRPVEIQPTPTRKPARDTSGMHQNTESLSLHDLVKLFGNRKAASAEKSSALRELRETLLHRVPTLKETLNAKSGYITYDGAISDRAYVYVQINRLVIDVRRPRQIELVLKKARIEILYRNNYQGRTGWTTGIRLRHDAPTHQIELVANEIIQALTE